MLNTAELFEHIPKQGPWKLPRPYHHSENSTTKMLADGLQAEYQAQWDGLLGDWIHYLDHASEGFQIYHRAVTEHIISGDLESAHAATYFSRSGLDVNDFEGNMTKVASIRRAFAALLSKDAQKKLNLKGRDIRASDEDIQNARTLVRNFERTISYINLPDDDEVEDDE
jgi:hypothetical protein